MIAVGFLESLVEAVPYRIHTVLTDNGVRFCAFVLHRSGLTARYRLYMFARVWRENRIERRLTTTPSTNGQVEQMNQIASYATQPTSSRDETARRDCRNRA